MKLLIAEKWQKSDTKLLENSSTAVLCWPQRKGDSTMTLGEKIASARKEKGMTQEMLAEQLGRVRGKADLDNCCRDRGVRSGSNRAGLVFRRDDYD